jgi:glycosyltransferase involved in cell wall biosynthesis
VAVINRRNTLQNQYCFPTKLGLYLINAVPVITTNVGETTRYLEHKRNAFVVQADEPRALADAMSAILNHPEKS